MTGPLVLTPIELLLRMSPLAFIQSLIYAYLNGELSSISSTPPSTSFVSDPASNSSPITLPFSLPSPKLLLALAGNGLIAFLLNLSSFSTNKNTGALTMTVCGNVKQCLTILLGIAIFGVRVGPINGVGMVGAPAGTAWYSVVELGARSMNRESVKPH